MKAALAVLASIVAVCAAAAWLLPKSILGLSTVPTERLAMLDRIKVVETSVEALEPGDAGKRFLLAFSLEFPETGRYRLYPAMAGSDPDRIFGNYIGSPDPRFFQEGAPCEAGKPYRFTLVFDTEDKDFDFATDKAHVRVADDKGPPALRTIDIGLEGVPAALAAVPDPSRRALTVPRDELHARTERSIRLAHLSPYSSSVKAGEPLVFTYDVTNVGDAAVPIPGGDFGNLIRVHYWWEPLSESAKATQSAVSRNGRKFAAGGNFVSGTIDSTPERSFGPGEKEGQVGRITQPLLPGDYRLHVTLSSRYSAIPGPVQTMTADFRVVP